MTQGQQCPLCFARAEVTPDQPRRGLIVSCGTCTTFTIDRGLVEYFAQTRRVAQTLLALARLSECAAQTTKRGYQLDIRANNWEALALQHRLDDELQLDDIDTPKS